MLASVAAVDAWVEATVEVGATAEVKAPEAEAEAATAEAEAARETFEAGVRGKQQVGDSKGEVKPRS